MDDDTIRRKAAIDALERKKDKNAKGDIAGFYNKIIQNDIDALMQLPSAQSRVIRCKDCKYRPKIAEGHDANEYTNNGFSLDFSDGFKCPCRCEDPYYSWMPDDNWFCANGAKDDKH